MVQGGISNYRLKKCENIDLKGHSRPFTCDGCNRQFKTWDEFIEHIEGNKRNPLKITIKRDAPLPSDYPPTTMSLWITVCAICGHSESGTEAAPPFEHKCSEVKN